MPLTPPPSLASHLSGECLTLATLWDIIRVDGTTYYYTDHDKDIQFSRRTYKSGIGYDRTSIDDKADLSPDNLDIQGILAAGEITRKDIRAGMFDGAEVWIRIVDWSNPAGGAIIRRRGWLGEVKQNNLGQFDTELRGLSEALSENLSRVYTPGCQADLGSRLTDNIEAPCQRLLVPDLRADATAYELGQEMRIADVDDLVFRATNAGTTGSDPYDDSFLYAVINDLIVDGGVTWKAMEAWKIPITVLSSPTPNRRTFGVSIASTRLEADPRHFDGGLITFLTGQNATFSREIKYIDLDSSDNAECRLYLRMPFDINPGDTGFVFPGCDKSIATCHTKFDNSINYKGFPHVPGDDYLKKYPDAKP